MTSSFSLGIAPKVIADFKIPVKNDMQIFRRKHIHFNFPGELLEVLSWLNWSCIHVFFNYEQTKKMLISK